MFLNRLFAFWFSYNFLLRSMLIPSRVCSAATRLAAAVRLCIGSRQIWIGDWIAWRSRDLV